MIQKQSGKKRTDAYFQRRKSLRQSAEDLHKVKGPQCPLRHQGSLLKQYRQCKGSRKYLSRQQHPPLTHQCRGGQPCLMRYLSCLTRHGVIWTKIDDKFAALFIVQTLTWRTHGIHCGSAVHPHYAFTGNTQPALDYCMGPHHLDMLLCIGGQTTFFCSRHIVNQ